VTETIEYEQFEQGDNGGTPTPPAPGSGAQVDLSRLSDIPMELSVEIGRTHMTVGETLDLRVGSVVTLERLAGETADLLVNGSAIARGEVVVIDEQYGLRVTEILDAESELAHTDAPADGDGDGVPQLPGGGESTPQAGAAAGVDGSSAGEG
jgi:flagellar motor switch protein FliN/FliY